MSARDTSFFVSDNPTYGTCWEKFMTVMRSRMGGNLRPDLAISLEALMSCYRLENWII